MTAATPPAGTLTYRLTDDQLMLRDAVRVLADERIAPRAAEIDRTAEFPQDVRQLLASHDVLGLPFAEQYGGLGGELLSVCLAIEQISRVCATSGLILAVQELGALPIVLAGSDEQQRRWLPALASGDQLIAFALTEAEAGSDAAAARTRAVRDGDDYVIDGSKRFISQGSVADLVTVFAVTDVDPDAPRHRRLSCFIVETTNPGFEVSRIEHKMGIRGSPTAELAFKSCGSRRRTASARRATGSRSPCGPSIGRDPGLPPRPSGSPRVRSRSRRPYARERKQFGKPIGELQMIQAMLADMDAQTEAARQLLYQACVEIDCGLAGRRPMVGDV